MKVGWFREGEAPVAIASTSILVLYGRGEISALSTGSENMMGPGFFFWIGV